MLLSALVALGSHQAALAAPTLCGNGIIESGEQCDDGGSSNAAIGGGDSIVIDCCSDSCEHTCCGDSIVNGDEQCDDGDSDNSDACNDDCEITEDNDGVPAATEDACPGDNGAPGFPALGRTLGSGDGNGDGIPDSAQSNVASLPSASGSGCLTLVATGCDLNDVEAVTPGSRGGDPGREYPFGLLGFILPGCETAQLQVFYHGVAELPDGSVYRKHGPTTPGVPSTTKFYTLPGVVFGSANVNGTMVATATFTLNDNELGDDTGDDNTIVDQGGPAGGPHSVPVSSHTGLALAILGLGVVAAFGLRRFAFAA